MSVGYPLDGAVCEGVATADYDPFFPEYREAEADALAMCSICPVRGPCLTFAVDTGQMFGIWGGRTQREVRNLIARTRSGHARAGRVSRGHPQADKTHCAYGHPFDAANTYYTLHAERRAPLSCLPRADRKGTPPGRARYGR